jgi:hypothetical protein
MVSHIVLFRPKSDLPAEARERLVAAFTAALRDIPHLLHARVGTRVTHGRPYEEMMGVNYEYAAVLEFADVDRLKAYLEHPVHDALGARLLRVSGGCADLRLRNARGRRRPLSSS